MSAATPPPPPPATHLWLLCYFICIILMFTPFVMPSNLVIFGLSLAVSQEKPHEGAILIRKPLPLITAGKTKCCDIRLCNPLSSEKCIQSRSNLSLLLEQYRDMKLLHSLDEWRWWFFFFFPDVFWGLVRVASRPSFYCHIYAEIAEEEKKKNLSNLALSFFFFYLVPGCKIQLVQHQQQQKKPEQKMHLLAWRHR